MSTAATFDSAGILNPNQWFDPAQDIMSWFDRTMVDTVSTPAYIYRGARLWSAAYLGVRSDSALYKGVRTLHP